MRSFTIIILALFPVFCYSQEYYAADSGKNEFKLQAAKDTPDYSKAYRILASQVKAHPKNAELHYFLGYTIDRMNAADGSQMIYVEKDNTIKASEHFEEVNRLQPIYKGELFVLDPYSKITSVWGSLAQAYVHKGQNDSARWALTEGKKRGGFIESILEFNRQMMNSCVQNAILITYGDNISFPCWYLQTMENYRKDIIIVDVNLLNGSWYPKLLKQQGKLKLSYTDEAIDSLTYKEWAPRQVTVINPRNNKEQFSWELRPTYYNAYVLKGDLLLLDIIQNNYYDRLMYFNGESDSSYNLYLTKNLITEGLVNRVNTKEFNFSKDTAKISENLYNYNIDLLKKEDIIKSREAITVLNGFRWAYYFCAYYLSTQGNYAEAREILELMQKKFPETKLPYTSDQHKNYFKELIKEVNSSLQN